jgi:membrane-bound ClpP family serine protease
MFGDIIPFILRILLIVSIWLFVWRFVRPRTQFMRVIRAALLVLVLLAALVVMRASGINY